MTLSIHQQKHIAAWHSSGLSQAAYCREHELNAKTFGNWLRIYQLEKKDSQMPAMIPLTINAEPSSVHSHSLYLRSSSGHALELPTDVSPQWLGELLKCLD